MSNNLVMLVLDSCRYDSFMRAKTPNFDRLGAPERRWSYASWTAPSHYAMLMGLMPHSSPRNVYASEIYKKEFVSWVDRLGLPDLSFETFLPQLSLPKVMGNLGYRRIARVSMPVLNGFTLLNRFFDDYKLMSNHNDFAGMVEEMEFPDDQPSFYFLNLGETHYPYMLKDAELPHIAGVHGAFKELAAGGDAGGSLRSMPKIPVEEFFKESVMQRLHQEQIRCVEYVDGLMEAVFDRAPKNTYFIVTADHGDAFGEDGYFGHGPVMHETVFQVPLLEGMKA